MEFRRLAQSAVACAALILAVAPQKARAQGKALTPALDSVRTLLDKYNDPIVAVHDGFYSSVGCISYPNGGGEGAMRYAPGAMGVHFLNMGNVGPTLDPAKPQVLIYEPVGDKLRLVAAEWFMPTEVAGGKAPSIFGQELGGPMEGHRPLMPDGLHHYDLHVWLWKNNPEGVFSPTNPAVKCPTTGYSFTEAAPKMVHPNKKPAGG
jgi:hypothetical protein